MTVFGSYAQFYDVLYGDKDYHAECDFLEQVFSRYARAPIRTILDLGCGTGGHALPLAQRGYVVTGVDRSETMLSEARRKAQALPSDFGFRTPDFLVGDIRILDLGRAFDAVIAMFAVISYQTTNEDLAAAFRTVRRHLAPGGVFVFDAWFGPAVLIGRPVDRYKIVEVNGERILRFAHPVLDILAQTVEVNYKILRVKDGQVLAEADEVHPMRFLFAQEIKHYLEIAGLEVLLFCPFGELGRPITEQDWNIVAVARAM
jgi:SAM-dependent methyltransferase